MANPMMQMLRGSESKRPNNPLAMMAEFRKFAATMTPQRAQQQVKKLLAEQHIFGISDMIPCNSSLLIQYDPGKIFLSTLLHKVKKTAQRVERDRHIKLQSRIIEIPVYFADPWTKEAIDVYCRTV